MLTAVLVLVTILLYFIYRKLDEFTKTINEDETRYQMNLGEYESPMSVKDLIKLLLRNQRSLNNHLEQIDFALNADNPAGKQSAKSRRKSNLVKLYAQYLSEHRGLTKKDAEARAAFEFDKFDEEKLVRLLDGDIFGGDWQLRMEERRQIEKAFYDTGLLEKDAKAQVDKLIPHDTFQSVWDLFVKQDYLEDGAGAVELGGMIVESEDSYDDFVKNRAIVLKLIKLGVIKPVKESNKDEYWLDRPTFDFVTTDLKKIKSIVYEGGSSHDDDHFEERFREGKLPRIFSRKI